MVAKQKVLLLGATGETGSSILNGLQESGNFLKLDRLYNKFLSGCRQVLILFWLRKWRS